MFHVFECGGCDQYHKLGWTGDCRDDQHRFTDDYLDHKYGQLGWQIINEDAEVCPDCELPIVVCDVSDPFLCERNEQRLNEGLERKDSEHCDECTGTRRPTEQHESHCSLFGI